MNSYTKENLICKSDLMIKACSVNVAF